MYNVIDELYLNNKMTSSWLVYIEQIINECGLPEIWLNQGSLSNINCKYFVNVIRKTLQDQYIQTWRSQLQSYDKCVYYKESPV